MKPSQGSTTRCNPSRQDARNVTDGTVLRASGIGQYLPFIASDVQRSLFHSPSRKRVTDKAHAFFLDFEEH